MIISEINDYLEDAIMNKNKNDYTKVYNQVFDEMAKIADPKKKSSLGPTRAVIDVKQNGYLVVVNGKEYVFNDFDQMSKWMKDHMSPKLDSSDFVDAL